jgi:hypothetical protein
MLESTFVILAGGVLSVAATLLTYSPRMLRKTLPQLHAKFRSGRARLPPLAAWVAILVGFGLVAWGIYLQLQGH